jgi:hypothetical protein
MPMSPRLLRPIASGVHPEANAWRTAVVANGGSVSASTMKAVSKFCADIDAAGIRDRFLRLNLFCGNSDASLNAARTPLYRAASRTATQLGNATDTSANFVQGDYAETGASGGLTGNGSNKRLATGLAGSQLNGHNIHLSAYEILPSTGTFDASVGVRSNFSAPGATLWIPSPNTSYQLTLQNNSISASPSPLAGHWVGVQTGSVTGALYRNGVSESTTYVTGAATASDYSTISHDFGVFAHNDGGSPNVFRDFSATRLGGYSIGLSMTSTQAAAFYTAMQAFQTALGRNV